MAKGIDVAKWQGMINWQETKLNGIEFAILKVVNKSMNIEDSFERNYRGALQNDVPIGVYNYTYAFTVEKAREDAKKIVKILNGRKLEYGVWLDIENNLQKGLGLILVYIINEYKKIIEEAGYNFGVYTGLSFYKSYIKPYASKIDCPFWIARYPSNLKKTISYMPNEKYKPQIEHELYAWQYSSKGIIKGIKGNVDLDITYIKNKEEKSMRKPVDYKQYDRRWKNIKYDKRNGHSTIGSAGCGTTCTAMVIASLKDKNVTPVETSAWSLEKGYKYPNGGTYYSYFVPQLEEYGIKCKRVNLANLRNKSRAQSLPYHNEVLRELKKGNWVIACMGKGNWTRSGHYILIYGYKDGYVYINDPASSRAGRLKNTFELVCKQVKYWFTIEVDGNAPVKEVNPYKEPWYTLKKNYRRGIKPSEYIKWLQWELKQSGYYKGKIDGFFGNGTERAFKKFQIEYPKSYKPRRYPDLKCGRGSRAILKEI